jgi:hypothetical protein
VCPDCSGSKKRKSNEDEGMEPKTNTEDAALARFFVPAETEIEGMPAYNS